jgi:uncharacterized membrane protein YebE (DUF533 family)
MLDQLLNMGQQALGQGNATPSSSGGNSGPGLGTGLLAGGALGALLGNNKLRKMGGGVVAYGGVAALGALAYKVFNDYQSRQAAAPASTPTSMPAATPAPAPLAFERLPAPVVETHAQAMLKALIAAAKADGHIDERERTLIQEKFAPLADDLALRRWVDSELAKPLDPADVASAATTPEMAAEMYLVSVLTVDEQSFMEHAYLDELARKLDLPAGLKSDLETRALAA